MNIEQQVEKAFKPRSALLLRTRMSKAKTKSYLAILMGVIIILADIYWLYIGSSYTYLPWLIAGIIIFIASIIWIGLDYSLMKQ
jgi:apolipoprotein N-acyltransferase